MAWFGSLRGTATLIYSYDLQGRNITLHLATFLHEVAASEGLVSC